MFIVSVMQIPVLLNVLRNPAYEVRAPLIGCSRDTGFSCLAGIKEQLWREMSSLSATVMVDPALTAEVEAVVKRATGVFLAQERSQQELHAAMKRCFAVVNSSVSEGMSAAILEAMDLRVPVLARNIPGNAAVVKHGVTGLLFSSPQEFVHQSQKLLSDHELRERVVRNGKLYVEEHHSVKHERETYQRLVDKLHKAQFLA